MLSDEVEVTSLACRVLRPHAIFGLQKQRFAGGTRQAKWFLSHSHFEVELFAIRVASAHARKGGKPTSQSWARDDAPRHGDTSDGSVTFSNARTQPFGRERRRRSAGMSFSSPRTNGVKSSESEWAESATVVASIMRASLRSEVIVNVRIAWKLSLYTLIHRHCALARADCFPCRSSGSPACATINRPRSKLN